MKALIDHIIFLRLQHPYHSYHSFPLPYYTLSSEKSSPVRIKTNKINFVASNDTDLPVLSTLVKCV